MIEDPPLLQIRRNFARPDVALVKRFANCPTEHLVDAMDGRGALDFVVKAIDSDRASFVGSAVTCLSAPGDNLAIVAALALLQHGDVIVAATDSHATLAVVGRRITGMARNRGAVAVVTDGLARDTAGIRQNGVPVFCRGVTPNSATASVPGPSGSRSSSAAWRSPQATSSSATSTAWSSSRKVALATRCTGSRPCAHARPTSPKSLPQDLACRAA